MLCQNCQINNATTHIKRIVNGETAELHLCSACASSLGMTGAYGAFSSFRDDTGDRIADRGTLRCETCGFGLADLSVSGSPGCPDCYSVFGDKLRPAIVKLHGRAPYKGKKPGKSAAPEAPAATDSPIVLSSSVIIRRNISGLPFPVRLNHIQKRAVADKIAEILQKKIPGLEATDMDKLYPYEAVALAERNLITPDYTVSHEGGILLSSPGGSLTVMLNENDHIAIRCSGKGLCLEKTLAEADKADCILSQSFNVAFDQRFGFINYSPSDMGTGMISSVTVHLPALSSTGELVKIAPGFNKLGFRIVSASGETSSVRGDLFRIENKVTLGLDEAKAASNLKSIVLQLATKERTTAEQLIEDISVKDKIKRAEGVLRNAFLLTTDEMCNMLSLLRLGAVYGLNDTDTSVIDELFITMQPANINVAAGEKLPSAVRDEIRAQQVRKALFGE